MNKARYKSDTYLALYKGYMKLKLEDFLNCCKLTSDFLKVNQETGNSTRLLDAAETVPRAHDLGWLLKVFGWTNGGSW